MEEYHQDEKDESIAKDPEVTYVSQPSPIMPPRFSSDQAICVESNRTETERLDIDEFYEQHKKEIEKAYKRIKQSKTKVPEGYHTLKEYDELLMKKLSESYEKI